MKLHTADELKEKFESFLFNTALKEISKNLSNSILQIMDTKAKRIRPLLLLTTCEAYGVDYKTGLTAASAIEIYHNFTLVHDDRIDNSDQRRNVETVHKKFGINKAILTGDMMLIHAYNLLQDYQDNINSMLFHSFGKVAREVIEGEQMDVDFELEKIVSLDNYIEMIRLKTAVLLATSLKMGAIIGGANYSDQKIIYEMGINLGLAFQIKDDYLDSFGDELLFGKKIGGDILQNKKTYLLCKAYSKASPDEKSEIDDITNKMHGKEKIDAMIRLYQKMNIHDDTMKKMEDYFEKVLSGLWELSIADQNKTRLLQLIETIYHRAF